MSQTTEEKLQEMLGEYYRMGSPGSPNAAILQNILGAENELRDPESENEALLKLIYEDGQLINQEAIERCEAAQEACEQTAAAVSSHTAEVYDSTKTYAVGDYVVYDGALYKCTTAVTTAEEWTAAHWTETTVGEELTDLQNQLDEAERQIDAVSIKDTASGAIASFSDGSDGLPVKSCVVQIEPIQDLHGYDNPWPAGGGKNLFDGSIIETTNPNNWGVEWNSATNSLTITHKNSYTIGIPEYTFNAPVGTYVVSFASQTTQYSLSLYIDGVYSKILNNGTTFDVESGKTYKVRFTANEGTPNTITKLQIESGSTATTFNPFANICPISGRTGGTVWRTGKNLLDLSKVVQGNWGDNTTATNCHLDDYMPIKGGQSYIWSTQIANISGRYLRYYDESKTQLSETTSLYGTGGKTFTTPDNAVYAIALWYRNTGITPADITADQIEPGSSTSSYSPYSGTSIPLSFGQTVYGGTVDVVSGELKTHPLLNMNVNKVGSKSESGNLQTSIFMYNASSLYMGDVISSHFKKTTAQYTSAMLPNEMMKRAAGGLYISFGDVNATADDLKAFISAQITAGTPITIYSVEEENTTVVTPVTGLVSLLGQNNIWADTGDTEVEYVADPKLYINKVVAALA